jgi:hypothetical protein
MNPNPAETAMNYTVLTYLVYLVLSVALTVWVARTLHTNGRIFLVDVFSGDERIADSVNHLLVVGFYLINVGYVALALKSARPPVTLQAAIEELSSKIGLVLLVLGAMHFFNLFVFSKLRRRALLQQMPPPIPPQGHVSVAAP